MVNLKDRAALITGAAGGVASAIATAVASAGAYVILCDNNLKGLQIIYDQIIADGGKAVMIEIDLCNADAVADLSAIVMERFGRLDILIAAAAVACGSSPLQDYNVKEWQKVIDVNLHANWYLIRYFDILLKMSSAAKAVFIECESICKNMSYLGPYVISKNALKDMVKIYASEVLHCGVEVALMDPGPVATGLYYKIMPGGIDVSDLSDTNFVQMMLQFLDNDRDLKMSGN